MNNKKERIIIAMEKFEKILIEDTEIFELALGLFLRSDKSILETDITFKQLDLIKKAINKSEYFMSDSLRMKIDSILENDII